MSFLKSSFGVVAIIIWLISISLLTIATKYERESQTDRAHTGLESLHDILMGTSNDRLQQTKSLVRILVDNYLASLPELNTSSISSIMNDLIRENPSFIAWRIELPDRSEVYISDNLYGSDEQIIKKFNLQNKVADNKLVPQNPVYLENMQMWLLPFAYKVHDSTYGKAISVILYQQLNSPSNPWLMKEMQTNFGIEVVVVSPINPNGQYYIYYVSPISAFGSSEENVYNYPINSSFITQVNNKINSKYGVSLKSLESNPMTVSYTIDKHMDINPANVVVAYNPNFDFFLSLRAPLSHLNEQVSNFTIKWGAFALFINILLSLGLLKAYLNETSFRSILNFRALHDALTGLPNRYYLDENVEDWLKNNNNKSVLFFLDLDNFKYINDHFGHTFGDAVLSKIGYRLNKQFKDKGIVSRRGGDEFLLLMSVINNNDVKHIAESLLDIINKQMTIDDVDISVSASIGIAIREKSSSFSHMLVNVDIALYEAKKIRNSYFIYKSELEGAIGKRVIIEKEMKSAKFSKEIYLVYQPQINIDNNRIIGIEALLRWESSSLGNVSPVEFISIAESCGMINSIGDFVLNRALEDMQVLVKINSQLRISINVSAHQFVYGNFAESIIKLSESSGIRPQNICIEVTESIFIDDKQFIGGLLSQLSNVGFHISLDDFGTGYSSLSMLKAVEIDELKIDRSFVQEILSDENQKKLLESIVSIGKSQGIMCLAEGVEEQQQVEILKEFGCFLIQGYYYSKPLKLDELITFIEEWLEN